ncbi:vWA domain-containing protein [Streptomyces kanasensis]|uniref:vWA domain-containing protein n=1 Tax=Streptomyces kanasensis TaxID=936756 RepID=UPI0038224AD9
MTLSPDEAVTALTDPAGPYLIGVRHHAPSLAAVVPALLEEAAPDVLLVELPAEMGEWLPWLAHEGTHAPVALAAVPGGRGGPGEGGAAPAFYPFADFSPELVAVRWAARHGVPVVACDLPLADPAWRAATAPAPGRTAPGLHDALRARLTGRPGDDLWDRLVEAAAPGSPPHALRRAALLTGWALRRDSAAAGGVSPLDLRRERWMRAALAAATANGERAAAVVGAFHAPALTPALAPPDDTAAPLPAGAAAGEGGAAGTDGKGGADGTGGGGSPWTTSLVPYTYALLDARSGYPAGIRDPEWQHLVLTAAQDPAALEDALVRAAVRICAELRSLGHPSGPADAREISRLAGDLARLRGLPAAGRGELVEAVQTVLAQGEPYGRGRAVARAMERVLVGDRCGRLAPDVPRSGLGPAVEAEVAALRLPGPGTRAADPVDLRLDPLRSDLDRRRELLLHRLGVCGVPYAEAREVAGTGGGDALTSRWEVRWTPATAAVLAAAGARGVTPAQAAEGVLREGRRAEAADGGPTAAQALAGLEQAARCALPALVDARLAEVAEVLPAAATLPELLTGLSLMDRVRAGHVPGLDTDDDRLRTVAETTELLTAAAVRQIDGLTGSEDPADARALVELAHRADLLGGVRPAAALARLAVDGSPLMRGAAGAVRVLLGHEEAARFGARAASWVDAAGDPPSRSALTARLAGLLTAAGPLLETAAVALEPLLDRVADLPDGAFLTRLPALRGGFDTLSPAARDRLLAVVEERLGAGVADTGDVDPAALALWTRADLAARAALHRLELLPPPAPGAAPGTGTAPGTGARPDAATPPGLPARRGTAVGAPAVRGATPAPEPPAGHDTDGDADTVAPAPPTHGGNAALPADPADPADPAEQADPAGERRLAAADRWRLVLGRRADRLPPAAGALATALDELYGAGRGEGSRGGRPGGPGGGREAPYPGVREWSRELAALFGPGVREEVLAAAAASGRADVLAELDPRGVRPSVELLRTVLRHAGGLPEARVAALRPLVRRLVDELTRQLATRLRPALHGTALPRPSRRPGGGLDLARTLRANLATARPGPDGAVAIVPERPVFRTRARRAANWRLVLVTDVSGSMEASTIWSALTASVLAGVPTLSTHFLAFSTQVVDLTDHVHDPLSLLLEVSVGGGTHIAAGLRHARELVTVPSRTLVVVVSDFEEGYPVGGLLAEVRALVGAGCHVLGCASLDDSGRPRYSTGVAAQLVAAGMPVAALSPLELAQWVGEKIS